MRILVTGGMGDIGRPMVHWLLDKGHEVRVLDLQCEPPIKGAECRQGSILDFASLHQHMQGMEGVIHLAAYREPSMAPETQLFQVNVDGTFKIFRAAADAGIKRVVCASSINALGYYFGITFPQDQLRYFPIDEEHPTYTSDPYSFSKQMIEEIGRYFWRREGITSLFLRFPLVVDPFAKGSVESIATKMKWMMKKCKLQTAQVIELLEPQRSQQVHQYIAEYQARAQSRVLESKFDFNNAPESTPMMVGRANFWTVLDVRDAAQAAEKGLLVDYQGSHAAFINDDHNYLGLPSEELIKVWFPNVTTRKRPLSGTESLVSIDYARELIGFEVKFPYRLA
ncbi:MAG: NAD-dependent epimerase/dehydratase family protein [Anaerolineales bacterium]